MEGMVYLLCAAASLSCSVLLLRGYRRSHFRLLLWSGLCFTMLTLENLVLFVDLILIPDRDLSYIRLSLPLLGLSLLLFGLIWEEK